MAEYQCVHSSHAISIRITDMLENMRGQSFGGANRTETVRDINDILQGRGGRSIESFLTELRNMGGFAYISEVDEIIRDVQAYLAQKTLLFQPYTKAGSNRQYRYSNYGLDQARPSKALKQWQYDRAVKQGFPPGFFRDRIFEGVNVYCLPDLADLSNSRFNSCNFSVCRVVDANFENTVFTSSSFDACYIGSTEKHQKITRNREQKKHRTGIKE